MRKTPNLKGAATVAPASKRWAFADMDKDREAELNQWREVSESFYHEMLGVLPPLYFTGGAFFVGEADAHTESGLPVHALFFADRGRYFARYSVATPNLQREAVMQLRQALSRPQELLTYRVAIPAAVWVTIRAKHDDEAVSTARAIVDAHRDAMTMTADGIPQELEPVAWLDSAQAPHIVRAHSAARGSFIR